MRKVLKKIAMLNNNKRNQREREREKNSEFVKASKMLANNNTIFNFVFPAS